ncbi:MAG: hypothetical protein AB8B59_01060 [Maribacter sp.]
MKSIITLLFILTCGASALANSNDHSLELNPKIENYDQVQPSQVGNLLDSSADISVKFSEIETTIENEVARLYKFKNSRIKKALTFSTKRNRAKMA